MNCELCAIRDGIRRGVIRYRIVPRRGVEPATDAIRRAVAWPGAASPAEVVTCGRPDCYDALRAVAVTVLAADPLGDDVVTREVAE